MDNKELILRKAADLFAKNGFKSTPLTQICQESGVSKGLILYHFNSKDNLLREVFLFAMTEMSKEVEHEEVSVTVKEKLRVFLDSFFEQLVHDTTLFKLSVTLVLQPDTCRILGDLVQQRAQAFLESVQQLFEESDIEDSLTHSYLFIAELDGIALNYTSVFTDYPLEAIKEKLIQKYSQF